MTAPGLTLSPAPGAAPLTRMIAAQARLETRTMLRNGEQLLLTLIIPLLLLAAFSLEPLVTFGAGLSRIDFLTPGIMALAVMSTAFTSQAIATGFERRYGVLKRLGATPLSRAGLIAAKTVTVIAVELLQAVLILLVALAIGWRPDASNPSVIAGFALFLLFSYALSWGCACLGMVSKSPESAQGVGLVILFPLAIVSNALVPTEHMPVVLRAIADWNPVSAVTAACRQLLGNPNPSASIHAWPMEHAVLASLLWSVALVAIFAPLASALYRRRTTD